MNTITTSNSGKVYEYGAKYNNPSRGPDLRKNPNKPRGFQISEMWASHHEIARMLLLGEKNVDIAKNLKCSIQTVSNVRNSPVVKDKLAIMSAARDADTINLSKEIMELAPIAIERVKEALTTGKVMDQQVSAIGILKEANNILDRQIGKPTQNINTKNIHGHFTLDDLERIKSKASILKPAVVTLD